jgi:hypothetical protein
MFDNNVRRVTSVGFCLLSFALFTTALHAGSFKAGTPGPNGGTVDITVTLPPGRLAPDGTNTIKISVNIPAGSTDIQKANAIRQGLSGPVYPGTNISVVPNVGQQGSKVTAAGSTLAVTGDTTAEVSVVADLGLSLPGSPAYATLGFVGPLTATATDGSESIFTASFGVDDSTFASASLTYNQLTTPTADGLMTALYYELLGDLTPGLQPDLSLDLPDDTITFSFQPGSGDYFVGTDTTSPGTSQSLNVGGVSSAPEPVTFFSLGTGLLLIGIIGRRSARNTGR